MDKLERIVKDMSKKYVITTAQYNAPINKALYEGMKKYCDVNKAQMIVIPTVGKSVLEDQILHKTLQEDPEILIMTNYLINNNLKIRDFGVRPQQINPLTGLERFAQGDKSYIMPGTKQALKFIPNSINELPKAIMTTGAITKPYYNLRHRVGKIATQDHTYGMVVVEVENNKIFHFRHVRAMTNGKFTDLGVQYNGKAKPKTIETLAIVPGDIHPYQLNKRHKKATFEQFETLKPKNIFLHDLFNGYSVSHHYKDNNSEYYKISKEQGLDLEKELKETSRVLNEYASKVNGTVYVVASNHDEHLTRYLNEGRFIRDKGNDLIGSKLYSALLEGYNPLEYGLSLVGTTPDNVVFLDRNDDFKIKGYQLGRHGDKGMSGARGSPRSSEIGSGKSISAHTHAPMIMRNVYVVGTSTDLNLEYIKGYYSPWVNTNGVLYKDGSVQLLNTIKGAWKK